MTIMRDLLLLVQIHAKGLWVVLTREKSGVPNMCHWIRCQ